MFVFRLAAACLCVSFASVAALTTRKVRVNYPTELLNPKTGSVFTANVTQDKLVCFGNDDYSAPTYRETLFCMLPYFPGTSAYCSSVWGSRTVEVEVTGSIEFLKVAKLPHETTSLKNISPHKEFLLDSAYSLELSTTRWLEMHSPDRHTPSKKTIQIPAEPIYLCARSTDWQSKSTTFSMKFRPAYLREKDKRQSHNQTLVHIILIVAVSSVWFIPYFAALVAAILVYEHGIKIMLTLFMFSTCLVCLTPLMFTKHNRQSARVYFNYFFTRIQAAEMRQHIIKRLPVFQALFFSSLLIFFGFGAVYGAYYYDLMEREFRNSCLKTILSVAISWFVFSLCRSFERFFKSWLWILMSMALAHVLDPHLNPTCRTEVVVAVMVISQVVRLIVPHVVQFQFINAIISSALPRLEDVSTKLRIPLPYQIYEHHSLQHLVYINADSRNSLHAITHTTEGTTEQPLLNITHTSTSTADLDHLYHTNSHPSTSRRASFASIHEIKPLVDYLDEVLEGREHTQGYGELGLLADLGEGLEDIDEIEQEEELEGEWSETNRSAGELLYLMGVTENADCEVQQDNNTSNKVNGLKKSCNNCDSTHRASGAEKASVPLFERLQGEHEPNHIMSVTGTNEERNRAALQCYENVSVEDIPQYTPAACTIEPIHSSAAAEATSDTANTRAKCAETAAATAITNTTGRVTRSKKAQQADMVTSAVSNSAFPCDPKLSDSAVNTSKTTINSTESSTVEYSQLIGATITPLSLVGPVCICASNVTGALHTHTPTKHWYPLATHNSALITSVQTVCSNIVDNVECTLLPPIQDTLTFTSTLRTNGGGSRNVAGAVAGSAWLQWPVPYLPHLLHLAIQADPTTIHLLSTLRASQSVHDLFKVECLPQGTTAVLKLSVSTSVVCSVMTLVTVGKALLRRILKSIQTDYAYITSDNVLVNYGPMSKLSSLYPAMHYANVSLTICVSGRVSPEALVAAHSRVDVHEASAHVKATLRALLSAINIDMKHIDQCDEWVRDVTFSAGDSANVLVSARVPVILTHYELNSDFVAAGANTCRKLLVSDGCSCDVSGCNNGEGGVDNYITSVCTLVVCSYLSFLLDTISNN